MKFLKVTQYYRSVPRLLQALQEAWQNDNVEQHAETTAIALYDLSRRPGFTARSVLPATLDFIQINGPHGVEGILLSALSAASVYEPRNFQRAIDKLILLSPTFDLEETKPEFRIGFVDFDTLPATPLPDVSPKDPLTKLSGGDEVLSGILEGIFKGRDDPEKLMERYGKVGAGIILNLLHTSFTDSARKLIGDLKTLNEARESQVLQGFGFTIRREAGGLDEFKVPGTDHVASGGGGLWEYTLKEARKMQSLFSSLGILGGAAGAGLGAAGYGGVATGALMVAFSGAAESINVVVTILEEAVGEAMEAVERLEQGTTETADEEQETLMPIPDDVGGGQATIFDILEALKTYMARLDPYINPTDDDLGRGRVTIVKIPISGDIDPLWEQVGGSMSEGELRAWIGFLQAKLFDSLVNPVPD